MKVLVVEDNKPIQIVVCRIIQGMNHEVISAETGEEALIKFREEEIDLILMDVEMPGINGFETTKRIRKLGSEEWFPIIFLSANSDEDYLAKGIDAGGDDYLVKPVKPIVLRAKIRAMERLANMRAELAQSNLQLANLIEELERLSYLDSLTGILNRRAFDQRIAQEWKTARADNSPLSLMLIDIDHFKNYNDHYGHLDGDNCLRDVARALASTLHRPVDLIARYGGEEFVVVLPNTNLAGAKHVGEALRQSVATAAIPHAETSVATGIVSISVGVNCTELGDFSDELAFIKGADDALYKAKENGRDRVEIGEERPCFDPQKVPDRRRRGAS